VGLIKVYRSKVYGSFPVVLTTITKTTDFCHVCTKLIAGYLYEIKQMTEYKLYVAESMLRIFAGILFFFQGYDKLFNIKMPGVIDTFMRDAERRHISRPLVAIVAYYTSIVEFVGGIFLVFGILTNYTLCAIGLDLILVSFAFSLVEPMWDMKHVFPRFILVILLLLLPLENDKLSLDYLINLKLK
jgi:putative oxidoreductase